jgi:hypothetical protein
MFDRTETATPAATAGALAMSCVDAAHTAVTVAAGMPVASLDGSQLRGLTVQLEQLRRVLDATEVHALAELDRRRHTDLRRGAATSKWLADRAQLPAGVARARLSLARRLGQDPTLSPVADSLDAGRIGSDHARVLAGAVNERNSDALAPVLDDLIEAARAMVFDVWKAHVEHLAAMADPDGSHDPDGDLLANTLTLSPSSDFLRLRGELVGEHAICVADVLNAVADDLFHQFSRDAAASDGALTVPPRSTLMALALEEVCRRALATDASSTAKPRVEASLVIHATRAGDPTPAQRRALLARDGCCTFPGCDAHIGWLDAHHLLRWSDGGPTDLHNMALVCRRHHRVAHRRGWSLMLDADGWTRWTAPDGHSFWGQRHHRQRAGPALE